jgi:hypothetical protein
MMQENRRLLEMQCDLYFPKTVELKRDADADADSEDVGSCVGAPSSPDPDRPAKSWQA